MKNIVAVLLFSVGSIFILSCSRSSSLKDKASQPNPAITKTFLFAADQGATSQIQCFEVDTDTGELTAKSSTPLTGLGNFVVTHPLKPFIFTLSWSGGVERVHGYSVDSDCSLTEVPNSPIALTATNYHESLAVHPSGKFLYVAEDDELVEGLAIDQETGALSLIPGSPFMVGPGTWPTTVAFTDDGQLLYTANQGSNDVSAFSVDSDTGVLTELAGSPYSSTKGAYWILAVGNNIITADRYDDSGWTSFSRDANGDLSGAIFLAGGDEGFLQSVVSPDGKVILTADEFGDSLEVVVRDPSTGALSRPATATYSVADKASGVALSPDGSLVVVSAKNGETLNIYGLDTSTAVLTLVDSLSTTPSRFNGLSFGQYSY